MENIDADLAVFPPDVDDLTDEDELNDQNTTTPSVRDVPGLVEVVKTDEKDGFDVRCTSTKSNPSAKKQRKERPKVSSKKEKSCLQQVVKRG